MRRHLRTRAREPAYIAAMLLTTTSQLQDRTIREYAGIVSGEAILGANVFRDLFASFRDIVGGRSGAYEKSLREAKDIALAELEEAAKAIGADAVIGIDFDYESITRGNSGGMLMVSASGTAVKLEPRI